VLKHGGKLLVRVPYVTLTEFNLVNPYHKQHFNEFSFDFFDPERLLARRPRAEGSCSDMPEFANEPPEKKEWHRRHCFNVVREIMYGVMAIRDLSRPLPVDADTPKRLMRRYA
jgi:hypothetical protein